MKRILETATAAGEFVRSNTMTLSKNIDIAHSIDYIS